jgi:hypothetical protein
MDQGFQQAQTSTDGCGEEGKSVECCHPVFLHTADFYSQMRQEGSSIPDDGLPKISLRRTEKIAISQA